MAKMAKMLNDFRRYVRNSAMDLIDGFRVFVAAVETGSFSDAAARVGISPKLASKYVGELEERLGARLLHRTTRRLGMTTAGERLMAHAPGWLDQLDEMRDALSDEQRGLSGVVRLSAPATFGEMRVAPMLQRFAARHPDLTIDLRLSDRFVDLAAEGVDLAIRMGQLDNSAMIARRLGRVEAFPVAAPAYLTQHGTPTDPADLHAHTTIRDSNRRGSEGWELSRGTDIRRFPITPRFTVNSARVSRDLAVAGQGIAFCLDFVVAEDLAAGRLIRVLPDWSGPGVDIHAIHLSQRLLARRTRALLDFMVADGLQTLASAPPL